MEDDKKICPFCGCEVYIVQQSYYICRSEKCGGCLLWEVDADKVPLPEEEQAVYLRGHL